MARLHVSIRVSLAALAAVCVAALSAPAANAARALGVPAANAARPDAILSNETTSSTWTVADYAQPIRSQPSATAPRVAKLQFRTPDGFLQSYVLLREHWNHGVAWIDLRVPGRPNGRTGWVMRSALDALNHTNMEVVVNRSARRLTVYRAGHSVFTAPVGVGKPGTPTPAGHFWITENFPSSDPSYGPYAFGTSDYSTLTDWKGGGIVGIHGTNEPQLVPGDPSHGCIRMHNGDVSRLSRMLSVGTPLLVQ